MAVFVLLLTFRVSWGARLRVDLSSPHLPSLPPRDKVPTSQKAAPFRGQRGDRCSISEAARRKQGWPVTWDSTVDSGPTRGGSCLAEGGRTLQTRVRDRPVCSVYDPSCVRE